MGAQVLSIYAADSPGKEGRRLEKIQHTAPLREGITTGTCAALAAKAAVTLLLTGVCPKVSRVQTPGGQAVTWPVRYGAKAGGIAHCAVQKDAGDDPDVTDRIRIWASVQKSETPGVEISGGHGVGHVTRPGLDQPVGAAAINRVPRQMIADAVREAAAAYGESGGFSVRISAPRGVGIAKRTFNARLGIIGGISILGTTGIVRPNSTEGFLGAIAAELSMHAAEGTRFCILAPGHYSERFLPQLCAAYPALRGVPAVYYANFAGDALDLAREAGFRKVLVLSHIGKLIKLAGGLWNTHSRFGDCRCELFTAFAAACGCTQKTAQALLAAATTEQCLTLLKEAGLLAPVLRLALSRIEAALSRRAGPMEAGAAAFSTQYGFLGAGEIGQALLHAKGGQIQ